MADKTQELSVFIIEDWRPVVPELSGIFESLGHAPRLLPNFIELVGRRVRKHQPDLVVVNAAGLVVGDAAEWRSMLANVASLLVVPAAPSDRYVAEARALRFDGLAGDPVSPQSLKLAIDVAMRNRRAAHRLRAELKRLLDLRDRIGVRSSGDSADGVRTGNDGADRVRTGNDDADGVRTGSDGADGESALLVAGSREGPNATSSVS